MRSLLSIPLHQARFAQKAAATPADAVMLDLEDGVPDNAKREARLALTTLADSLRRNPGPQWFVRINAAEPHQRADLDALATLPKHVGVIVGKANPATLAQALLTARPVIALLESLESIRQARELPSSRHLVALMLGTEDILSTIGRVDRPQALVQHLRCTTACEAHTRGIEFLNGPWVKLADQPGLVNDCEAAQSAGATGKLCIHPGQVDTVNQTFTPQAAEIQWAQQVLQAADAASGAIRVGTDMVDAPAVRRAQRILGFANNVPEE